MRRIFLGFRVLAFKSVLNNKIIIKMSKYKLEKYY